MTQPQEPPTERLDRLETALGRLAELNFQNAARHDRELSELREAIATTNHNVNMLVEQGAADRQQAAIDRQAWQSEIQRIWEYLLQQSGNGRGGNGM